MPTTKNIAERREAEKDPHHPRFKVIFALYSWWLSDDDREFVIAQRWSDGDGRLQYLELLEKNTGVLKIVPYETFYRGHHAGKLTRTSPYVYDPPPPVPSPYLTPDRNC